MATLKRDGICCRCHGAIAAGTLIKWERVEGRFKPAHNYDCQSATQSNNTGATQMSDTDIINEVQALYHRGETRVTSSPDGGNRGGIRKWIIARGAMASQVVKLTLAQLGEVYNDTTDQTLHMLVADMWPKDEPVVSTPVQAAPVAAPSTDLQATVMQLVTLLQSQQQTAAVDADMVRKIMRDEMSALIPVTRIEVVNGNHVVSLDPAPLPAGPTR